MKISSKIAVIDESVKLDFKLKINKKEEKVLLNSMAIIETFTKENASLLTANISFAKKLQALREPTSTFFVKNIDDKLTLFGSSPKRIKILTERIADLVHQDIDRLKEGTRGSLGLMITASLGLMITAINNSLHIISEDEIVIDAGSTDSNIAFKAFLFMQSLNAAKELNDELQEQYTEEVLIKLIN